MPNFLWTAKDELGRPVIREVAADNVEQSKTILLAEGCTDLELKGDEITDAAHAFFTDKPKMFGKELPPATAEDRLKHRGKPPPTFWRSMGETLVEDKRFYITLSLVIGITAYRGFTANSPASALIGKAIAIVLVLAMLAWPAFKIWLRLPTIYFRKLNEAKDWHRWPEVLELVKKLENLNQSHTIKLPAVELMRSRAQALAGTGKLSEALAEHQRCEHQPGMTSWLHKAHLAGIYGIAKQYDKSLEYNLQAIQEKPTHALYLDLANRFLRYEKNTVKALEALVEAEKETLTDIAKPFHIRCRGILAYLEGDSTLARRELETSLKMLEQTRHQPFREGHISIVKAYLCCVLAKLGDTVAARKYFTESRKYLLATDETELLAECKKAVGE